jgi:adenylate cyclase
MLLTFLTENQAEIVTTLTARIRNLAPAYRAIPEQELSASVHKGMEAGLAILRTNDLHALDRFIATTVAARLPDNFPLSLLYAAFTAFGELLPSILHQCHGDNTARIAVDLQRLHMLKDTMLSRLVQHYEEQAQRLVRQQQEQLQAYSTQLEQQLVQVGDEFQTLQEFNESIIQSMTSGLMVADKETRRILKINKAMERQANIRADDVVGKTVDEVFDNLRGLPLQEFSDEVERHGTIARRTHRLYTDSGREFYRSITGQVFYNHKGEYKGVIVIADDISDTELLRDTFRRYLSPHVLEQVLAEEQRPSLQSVRRDVTVLFTDLRNFTSFAELYEPEEVVEVLNQYLDVMVGVLFEHEGTLDKFAGDGLLALFGTPLFQPDHHCRAVQAALDMQRAIAALNARRHAQGEPVLDVGIGINSGEAIVGNIGSEKRMEFTVIGDMVNIAHRLQARARGGDILIGDQTLAHVQHLVTVYETTEEPVKGRQRPVRAHSIGPRTA